VARPHELDGLGGANTCAAGIARGAEPVVLGGASGAGADANVGGAVDSVANAVVDKVNVVGDNGGGQMVRHALAALNDVGESRIRERGNHLEGPKDLGRAILEVLGLNDLGKRDKDGGRLQGTILLGDGMVGKLLATKADAGTREAGKLPGMLQHLLRGVGENGSDSQIFQLAAGGNGGELVDEARADPVLVGEEDGLRRALLASVGIGILIALPGNVVDAVYVRPKDLPVKPSILKLNLTVSQHGKLLGDLRATGELGVAGLGELDEFGKDTAATVNVIDISEGSTAKVHQAKESFHNNGGGGGALEGHLVAHVEGTHELEPRNLKREVEGSNESTGTEWPTVAMAALAAVIPRNRETTGKKADLITTEVLKEHLDDGNLTQCLGPRLRASALDALRKVIGNIRLAEFLGHLRSNLAVEKIAFNILVRVVKASLGALVQGGDEWSEFIGLGVGHLDEWLAI